MIIESQNESTVACVVECARRIWGDVEGSAIRKSDDRGNNALLKELSEKYKDFAVSYPLILRWMVQAREFDAEVFERYLQKYGNKTMFRDRIEFLEAQGEYLVMAYQKQNRHKHKNVKEYRAQIRKQLHDEDKEFTEKVEEAGQLVKEIDAAADVARRQRMIDHLRSRPT